ncbi:MAG TPA: DUF4124 domain-containing protein [Hydrogenophaga sp.]|uniref:DUF4124 domain-containing protein n=1 Tax=Hydrogenophaga sp. TaxID=1904254 RepID=UPI002C9E1980|nr:DUF4124 domain-containing protein [Hydrogenophaga sp.]HMN94754.1 DUF4124 domain-containing protein [Hydrogenophaga sp.]HMP12071.1 DUF4124 domain-containing protein [Hydrogenophaga sp.]
MGAAHWFRGALALALVFGSGLAVSDVYRWTDENGVVHFGDRPHSTDPKAVNKVTVPRPNLAEGYKPPLNRRAVEPPGVHVEAEGKAPSAPAQAAAPPPVAAPPGRGFAEHNKTNCQAKKAAFAASEACFRACGKIMGGGFMNNSGCDHCVDQPEPRC